MKWIPGLGPALIAGIFTLLSIVMVIIDVLQGLGIIKFKDKENERK